MWKQVADLRVLSYGYPDTKGLSLYRPTRRAVKLGVQTTRITCPPAFNHDPLGLRSPTIALRQERLDVRD